MKYDHLIGLEFNIESRNCYHLLRDLYSCNFGIELPDVPCPTDWWNKGLDLYRILFPQNGFTALDVHPRDWRAADVIVMAIQSSTGNHLGIVLDNGNILHHLVGQRSRVTSYSGTYRNSTVGVYRHRDVPPPTANTVDIKDLDLPAHIRRRLDQTADH